LISSIVRQDRNTADRSVAARLSDLITHVPNTQGAANRSIGKNRDHQINLSFNQTLQEKQLWRLREVLSL
jgi:hypothetical protein